MKVEMTIANDVLEEISHLSRGLPHYSHLLGLYAGRAHLMPGALKSEMSFSPPLCKADRLQCRAWE
jgi:hypothetical protein